MPGFENSPLYLAIMGVLTLVGGLYAIFRGNQDRARAEQATPTEARWFFDGPLNVALTYLRDIAKNTETVARLGQEHSEALRQQTRQLEEIKRELDARK